MKRLAEISPIESNKKSNIIPINSPSPSTISPAPSTPINSPLSNHSIANITKGLNIINNDKDILFLESHLKYALAGYYADSLDTLLNAKVKDYMVAGELSDIDIIHAKGTDFAGFVAIANDIHLKQQFIVVGFRGTISIADIWTDLNGDLAPSQPFYKGWWNHVKLIAQGINSGIINTTATLQDDSKESALRRERQAKRLGFVASQRNNVVSNDAMEMLKDQGVGPKRLSSALDSVLSISKYVIPPDSPDYNFIPDEKDVKDALISWVSHFEETGKEQLPFIQRGFWEAWSAIRLESLNLIDKKMKKYPDLNVHFVGHSLGGTFATLAAIEILWNTPLTDDEQLDGKLQLITYGKPRIGNIPWAKLVLSEKAAVHSHRVVNHADIIPHLPPASRGFFHLPGEVWLCWTNSTIYKAPEGISNNLVEEALEQIHGLTPFHHFLSSYFFNQKWLVDPFPKPSVRIVAEIGLLLEKSLEKLESFAAYGYEHFGIGKPIIEALEGLEDGITFISQHVENSNIIRQAEDDASSMSNDAGHFLHRTSLALSHGGEYLIHGGQILLKGGKKILQEVRTIADAVDDD